MKKIGGVTDGKVRRKRKTPDVFSSSSERKKLESAVRRSPSVVVKISGGCKGAAHMKSHLEYISRNGKLELENEQGDKIADREALNDLHKLWASNPGKSSERTKHTLNMVFSMPEGTDSKAIQRAVRELALKEFGDNYRYVMALHTPETDKKTKQPHVHLTINTTGHDLTRLSLGRADLQRLRDGFAEHLREQGISADSSKREARGITTKAIKTPIQQMNQRGVIPKVEENKYREVARELAGGSAAPKPWEAKILAGQKQVRKEYLETAIALFNTGKPDDLKLAVDIQHFVNEMPKPITRRHQIAEKIIAANKGEELVHERKRGTSIDQEPQR